MIMVHSSLKKGAWKSAALCVLCSLLGSQVGGQTAPTNLMTNKILLQRGLQQLDAMTPVMDDETKKRLGAMKNILERVCLDRQHATDSELQVASVLLRADTSRSPEDSQKKLREILNQMPGIASEPKFVTGSCQIPGARQIGYVDVILNGRKKTLIEIPAAAADHDVVQRAEAVAKRIREAQANDALWWTQITIVKTDSGYSIRVPESPDDDIIKADPAFAREWGLDPQGLAKQLIFDIGLIMDPSTLFPKDVSSEEACQNAVDQRQAGDAAFNNHDLAAAEKDYRAALQIAPEYVVAYTRLGNLYSERQEPDKARTIMRKALSIKSLDLESKHDLQQMLSRSK